MSQFSSSSFCLLHPPLLQHVYPLLPSVMMLSQGFLSIHQNTHTFTHLLLSALKRLDHNLMLPGVSVTALKTANVLLSPSSSLSLSLPLSLILSGSSLLTRLFQPFQVNVPKALVIWLGKSFYFQTTQGWSKNLPLSCCATIFCIQYAVADYLSCFRGGDIDASVCVCQTESHLPHLFDSSEDEFLKAGAVTA